MASLIWFKGKFKGEQSDESRFIRLGINKCSGKGAYIAKGNILNGIEAVH